MNARDELAAVLHHRKLPYGGRPGIHTSLDANAAYAAAELVLAAGYRRPRVIMTVEELDALPDKTVVLDADHDVWRQDDYPRTGKWWDKLVDENPHSERSSSISLPAKVLYEPEVAL